MCVKKMETIYKYKLSITDLQFIEMPNSAVMLTVQTQNEEPFIYAKVNTENILRSYRIRIFGTGNPIEKDFIGKYIGTFQLKSSGFVFHVYLEWTLGAYRGIKF
jgi:hypothetical protein